VIKEEDVYKIGRLGKTHGVRGEVSFLFDDDVFDRVDANAIVKFDGIDTQERARELTGCDVFFPRSLAEGDDGDISWSILVGFDILEADSGKAVGRIAAIDDATMNILFELEDGRLIPASEDLITAIDQKSRTITMHIPEGLLEL
jgi:16S rRNA processing protein RimM